MEGLFSLSNHSFFPHAKPINHTPDVPLPLVASILGSVCVLCLLTAVYCTWRCWKTKLVSETGCNTPNLYSPSGWPASLKMKISQSVPELLNKDKAGVAQGSHPRTVIKQSTLPVVPPRHMNFQRQLSHQLDMSNIEFTVQSIRHKEQPSVGHIRPELYQQDSQDTLSNFSTSSKTAGTLFFTLQYLHQEEYLVVNLLRAENLPAKDFSGTSDPYVKIHLLPDRKFKHQTKVHRRTLAPQFNESFVFSVAFKDLLKRVLQFSIYDFDRFSRHDLIGIVMVKDLGKSMDLSYERPYAMDICCVQQEKVDLGELMMSLCYLPTAGRLTVTVIKARNLKPMDLNGNSDPYVKISLMCQGKRIKKRKTSVVKNTLFPVYNEAMVFDVPQENVEDVALLVHVIDYDRVGSNELMGCCAIGTQFAGSGRNHWFCMLENQRKPVAQWHSLHEQVPGYQHITYRKAATSCLRNSVCTEVQTDDK